MKHITIPLRKAQRSPFIHQRKTPHDQTATSCPIPFHLLPGGWVDQAAIQEFPYKLILLGQNQSLLFDITNPEPASMNAKPFFVYLVVCCCCVLKWDFTF